MLVFMSLVIPWLLLEGTQHPHLLFTNDRAQLVDRRKLQQQACITSFDRSRIAEEERGFLVFTAPAPFSKSDETNTIQLPAAMQSWNEALKGRGRYVVITNDPLTRSICQLHNIPTVCVDHVDEGVPRLDVMFKAMQNLQTNGIVAYVNSDIHVEDITDMVDFLKGSHNLERVKPTEMYQPWERDGSTTSDWFSVAVRTDVDKDGAKSLHTLGGYDFWAWNTDSPLLPFPIPPFRFPFATYDNWLLDMMIQVGHRAVIDISATVELLHYEHKRLGGQKKSWTQFFESGVTGVFLNKYFAHNEPRSMFRQSASPFKAIHHIWQFGTPVECPYYVAKDRDREAVSPWKLMRREYWSNLLPVPKDCIGNVDCEDAKFRRKQTAGREDAVAVLPETPYVPDPIGQIAANNWRYTRDRMLESHATSDGFVLLTAVNFSYRDLLMNFKCNLERVGMVDNFVVAALDKKMYRWGLFHGLPIFFHEDVAGQEDDNTVYGSLAFQQVTKSKSRVVLEVLKAGYSVIWSDVDIVWFEHPMVALAPYMDPKGGMTIQSNAPFVQDPSMPAVPHSSVSSVKTDKIAAFRRLNSGLYVAPCNHAVKSAIAEIIRHAATSAMSEQPSFDYVLCQRRPSQRFDDRCRHRRSFLSFFKQSVFDVRILDRFHFPNGATLVGPNNENAFNLGRTDFSKATGQPLLAAHNNWIAGGNDKKQRQIDAGWWFVNHDDVTCIYPNATSTTAVTIL